MASTSSPPATARATPSLPLRGGNSLSAGNGSGDTFTLEGGDNAITAGNGGDTFNLYDDDNTATATGGSNTFNLLGASGAGDTSGDTVDLAGTVINGGTGGTNTLAFDGGSTLILSDDDGNITNIQALSGCGTLNINADQMAGANDNEEMGAMLLRRAA